MPSRLDLIGSILALQWIDTIPIVVDPSVPVRTTARRLAPLGARRILTGDAAAAEAFAASGLEAAVAAGLRVAGGDAPLEPLARPEGIAFLQQTSGSTGEPKASAISHRSVVAQLDGVVAATGREHVFVGFVPIFH